MTKEQLEFAELHKFDELGPIICEADDDDSEELWFDFLNPTDFTDGDD